MMGLPVCKCGHGMDRHVQKQKVGSNAVEVICVVCNTICKTID